MKNIKSFKHLPIFIQKMKQVVSKPARIYILKEYPELASFLKCDHKLALKILKDLDCGLSVKTINAAFPGIINIFNVSLAEKYEPYMTNSLYWDWSDWIVMRKYNGIRTTIIIDHNSNARFYSRYGNEFKGLGRIGDEIKRAGLGAMVLDGETCIMDRFDNDNYNAILSDIQRVNYTIPNPTFIAFDQLTRKEHSTGISKRPRNYKNRLKFNVGGGKLDFADCEFMKKVEFEILKDEPSFYAWRKKGVKSDWEGLILRNKYSLYRPGRSQNILKVKEKYLLAA